MRNASSLVVVLMSWSLVAAGPAFADKAPPPPPETKPADGTPAPDPHQAVHRIEDTRPRRLPDGVFTGTLVGEGDAASLVRGAELRVTIVGGRVTEAFMRRPGGLPLLDLTPVEAGDSIEIRLQGSNGSEFVRINGAFFDAERGAGRFDGVLGRHKSAGSWLLARR